MATLGYIWNRLRRHPIRPRGTIARTLEDAVEQVLPGVPFTTRDLLEFALVRNGLFRRSDFASFGAAFSKLRVKRDDIELVADAAGRKPAIYRKRESSCQPQR